jgi:hypothetical protein
MATLLGHHSDDLGECVGDYLGECVGDDLGECVGDNVGDIVDEWRRIAPLGFRTITQQHIMMCRTFCDKRWWVYNNSN